VPLHPKYGEEWDNQYVTELTEAMEAVGFATEDQIGVWQLVAGLVRSFLHLKSYIYIYTSLVYFSGQ
jgi:hypothetical protein